MTCTCPECGYEFGEDADEDEDEDPEPTAVGECADCSAEILLGEWHVLRSIESDRVPDGTACRVVVGEGEDAVRVCADCSDRDPDEFPDGGGEQA